MIWETERKEDLCVAAEFLPRAAVWMGFYCLEKKTLEGGDYGGEVRSSLLHPHEVVGVHGDAEWAGHNFGDMPELC